MQRAVIGVVVAALLGGAFAPAVASTPNAASEPGIQALVKGDPERKAILDALRVAYAQKVVFLVHYLKISGDWAWARVTATADGKPASAYESESALVRRIRGK